MLKYFILVPVTFLLVSCDSERSPSKEDRYAEDDFFSESTKTETLDTLQNELNRGETELLRMFAVDPIPWQKWDSSILEKARVRQAPIFLYIVSGLSEDSRSIAIEISERKPLRKALMDRSVCAVADIQMNPELGILAHQLSSEINLPTTFPTLLWMSHEGAPITWLPISKTTGRKLETVLKSSAAMVEHIWGEESNYAISNSRINNQQRQDRIDMPNIYKGNTNSWDEAFRMGTRKISALYTEIDKNIDNTGGLLPTSALELLTLGSMRADFPLQVRKKSALAVSEVSNQLLTGALKDHLDGSYFYARRNVDWSLPVFSKNLESQASLARFFLNSGTITKNQNMVAEGQQLLEVINKEWLAQLRSFIAPLSNPDREGSFIFGQDTLAKILNEDEQKLATLAYSMKPDGNIPGSVDPLGIFYEKNTLRRILPMSELATQSGLSEQVASQKLEEIRKKLLAHRLKVTKFLSDPLISAGTFARVVRAQIAGANSLDDDKILAAALQNGSLLRKNYTHPSDGLSLFPIDSHQSAPRSKDYSLCALAALELYQATLDPQWLQWSVSLMDEALQKLSREGHPLRELPESESIIPLIIHNRDMIFSDSSVGISHQIFHQLSTLTGEKRFQDMADLIVKDLSSLATLSPVTHTDFLISSARGIKPLVAVVQGMESSAGKNLLHSLNSPQFLPYLNVRGDHQVEFLKKIADLPSLSGEAAVALYRGDQLVGSASNPADLEKLLGKEFSQKE